MPKDVIIDPEWEQHNEQRGAWGARPRRPEPDDLDPFGVDKPVESVEPVLEVSRAKAKPDDEGWSDILDNDNPPFDPDPAPNGFGRPSVSDAASPTPSTTGTSDTTGTSVPHARPEAATSEPEPDPFAEPEPRRKHRVNRVIAAAVMGDFISKGDMKKALAYMGFAGLALLIYMSLVFGMQELHRREMQLTRQVRELRAISLDLASRRMNYTRQSNILKEIEARGIPLKEAVTPPKVVSSK